MLEKFNSLGESRIDVIFSSIAELSSCLGLDPSGYSFCLPGVMLKELTDNSIDAVIEKFKDSSGEKARIEVFIEKESDKKEGDRFLIEVRDNGWGLPEEEVKKLSPYDLRSTKRLSGRITRGRKGNALSVVVGISSLVRKGVGVEIETNKYRGWVYFEEKEKVKPNVRIIPKSYFAGDSYTLIRAWAPALRPWNNMKYILMMLFAQILLSPYVTWRVEVSDLGVLDLKFDFEGVKNCKFLKNKFLYNKPDLRIFSLEEFLRIIRLFVKNGKGDVRVENWLSSYFQGFSRIKEKIKENFKDCGSEKVLGILKSSLSTLAENEEDALVLYRTLKRVLRSPLNPKDIETIGKEPYKRALEKLSPVTEKIGFIIDLDIEYFEIYPEEVIWDDDNDDRFPYFKIETVFAPIKEFSDDSFKENVGRVVYLIGINGSCTYVNFLDFSVRMKIDSEREGMLPPPSLFEDKIKHVRSLPGVFILINIITPCDVFSGISKDSIMLIDKKYVTDERYKEKVKICGPKTGEEIVEKIFNLIKKKIPFDSNSNKSNKIPSVCAFVRDKIDIIVRDAQGGIPCKPTLRQGYYVGRRLYSEYGVMTYDAFEKAVTKLEKERGEYLFSRDTRGHIYIPHLSVYEEIDLEVDRIIERIEWRSFSGVLYVEKEGFREIMEAARIAEKYDLAIVYGKGFATEGASLFFEKLVGELSKRGLKNIEVKVFVLHDADPSGYSIFLDLVRGSWFWEKIDRELLKKIHFIDLGLTVSQAQKYNLSGEHINSGSNKNNLKVLASLETLIRDFEERIKKEFAEEWRNYKERIKKGFIEEWENFGKRIRKEFIKKWRYIKDIKKDCNIFKKEQKRYELNEFSGGALIAFLEERLRECGVDKVKPIPKEVQERIEKIVGVEYAQIPREILKKSIKSALIDYFEEKKVIDKLAVAMEKIINEEDWSLERFVEESHRAHPGDPRPWAYFIEGRLKSLEKEFRTKIEEDLNRPDSELLKLLLKLLKTEL